MSYDRDCSTYWCDECNSEMVIDHSVSDQSSIILTCTNDTCSYRTIYWGGEEWVPQDNETLESDEPFWTDYPRADGRMEWQCPHGVGHGNHTHACDGCCSREDYPGLAYPLDKEDTHDE